MPVSCLNQIVTYCDISPPKPATPEGVYILLQYLHLHSGAVCSVVDRVITSLGIMSPIARIEPWALSLLSTVLAISGLLAPASAMPTILPLASAENLAVDRAMSL